VCRLRLPLGLSFLNLVHTPPIDESSVKIEYMEFSKNDVKDKRTDTASYSPDMHS